MTRKTPPYKEYEKWTTARFWSFIRSAIRKAYTKWPPKYLVLARNKRNAEYEWYGQSGRKLNVQYEYQCDGCKEWFERSSIEIDHKVPVGSLNCAEDLPGFVTKMFVSEDKLQLLCRECHQEKTNAERAK